MLTQLCADATRQHQLFFNKIYIIDRSLPNNSLVGPIDWRAVGRLTSLVTLYVSSSVTATHPLVFQRRSWQHVHWNYRRRVNIKPAVVVVVSAQTHGYVQCSTSIHVS